MLELGSAGKTCCCNVLSETSSSETVGDGLPVQRCIPVHRSRSPSHPTFPFLRSTPVLPRRYRLSRLYRSGHLSRDAGIYTYRWLYASTASVVGDACVFYHGQPSPVSVPSGWKYGRVSRSIKVAKVEGG